jgi:hypothetical protein
MQLEHAAFESDWHRRRSKSNAESQANGGADTNAQAEAQAKKNAEKKAADEKVSAPTLYLELDTIFVEGET